MVSALYDRYSVSAGAFGYRTDGWRKNNDINQNVQDVFFQTAITPELNAQVEFRRRDSDFGDLAFNFDPDFFSPNLDQTSNRTPTARACAIRRCRARTSWSRSSTAI